VSSAINKAFSVITLLRRSGTPMTLTEIARTLRIAPSTTHSILNELAAQGVVTQDGDRRYRLGPATFYLGASYARGAPIYRSVWRDLIEVGREMSLTAVVAVPWQDHHLILNVQNGGTSDIEVAFGGRVPIDAGAWGKAYYAWSDNQPPTGKPASYTSETTTRLEDYEMELRRSRDQGYAVDLEEFIIGAGAVASAVTSEAGFEGVSALIGAIGDLKSVGIDEAGRRVAAVASRASYALGDHSRVRVVGVE
jgi:DNA-binding IclR family transcriptional regulator